MLYQSEIIVTTTKFFKHSASASDLKALDDLINERVAEGYEFVCHSYMPNVNALKSAILVTFRKVK